MQFRQVFSRNWLVHWSLLIKLHFLLLLVVMLQLRLDFNFLLALMLLQVASKTGHFHFHLVARTDTDLHLSREGHERVHHRWPVHKRRLHLKVLHVGCHREEFVFAACEEEVGTVDIPSTVVEAPSKLTHDAFDAIDVALSVLHRLDVVPDG